jgi:nicotinamide-nucleotide amidase
VICTGSELLQGHTLNSNLAFLGAQLDGIGLAVSREVSVPDGREAIAAAVLEELRTADVLITVGGLGPTSDDLTREAVAELLGLPLRLDAEVLRAIESYLADRKIRVPAQALRIQAMVPETALALPNLNGTAPGLWCRSGGKTVILLPGPPRELEPMFVESVRPRLQAMCPPQTYRRVIRICGLGESTIAEKVDSLLASFPGIEPAYCATPALVDVRLSAELALQPRLDQAMDQLIALLGNAVLPADCPTLAAAVGAILRQRGWSLATAESCTGGKIAAAMTDQPGASAFFAGAVVAYSNEWKQHALGVRPDSLARYGAVSAEVAREMLDGLLSRYDVDAGIAVTGIAGPSGGTDGKPVGLVYIATGAGHSVQVQRFSFPGNRDSVRTRTAAVALNQLRLQLLHETASASGGGVNP